MRWSVSLAMVGVIACFAAPFAYAQQSNSLVTVANSSQAGFNRLERLSAIANQDVYNRLDPICNPGGSQQPLPACGPGTAVERTYENVRELVHTANELLGSGPTQFSLGSDAEGLGFALRWTAAEELAAPGASSSEFANAQLASVLSRINALRLGASGFAVASFGNDALGGAAAAGDSFSSRWGGFLNGSYGYGERDPSELEDAFAFDTQDAVLGIDYRFSNAFVFGAMFGYARQTIDFDSTQSVVSGGIESDGLSVTLYGLYEWDGPYLSLAAGMQQLSIDIKRVINYPSGYDGIPGRSDSVYATATGDTKSQTLTGSLAIGWPVALRAFGIEPSLRAEYRDIGIDAFKETSVHNIGPDAGQPAGFDFAVGDQSITALTASFGLKIQYSFTPSFGVLVPYAKAEMYQNLDTDPFTVSASYNGQAGGNAAFNLPSEERDDSYQVFAGGASLVLRGGWQGFVQYQYTAGIDYLSQQVISGGIRGEF
ncbi:MAG TPA: autotransporter outer membrane beta-barrel domain-containing protein [Steroidobacteraceae bacterium]|nr:autotransporter outer membrane beta-barrel domain-containing protein [Steroidobacteraceae bacterium]